jgi:hypothetical protein
VNLLDDNNETSGTTLLTTTLSLFQAPAAAFPSGRRCSPATSSTQTPRTALARKSAPLCSRTTTSAYTTAKRYPNHPLNLPTPGTFLTRHSKTGRSCPRSPIRIPQAPRRKPQRRRPFSRSNKESGSDRRRPPRKGHEGRCPAPSRQDKLKTQKHTL